MQRNRVPFRRTLLTVGVLLLTTVSLEPSHAGPGPIFSLASSTFDSDADGWLISGDASTTIPTYRPTGGNPDGHIEAVDSVVGGVWYFQAPRKFLSRVPMAHHNRLLYDLKVSTTSNPFDARDVILSGGGLEVWFNTTTPTAGWNHYAIPLSASAGWMLTSDNSPISEAQLAQVLDNLGSLRIRGEFQIGADTGWLDNVHLEGLPRFEGDIYSAIPGLSDGGACLTPHQIGIGINVVGFDGLPEAIDPYSDGTEPVVTEQSNEDRSVTITFFSEPGTDLFPEGFEDPKTGAPLDDACVEIGGLDPLEGSAPYQGTEATIEGWSNGLVVYPETDISELFATSLWDGTLHVQLPDAAGLDMDEVHLTIELAPSPQELFSDGFESGDASAWQ